MALLNYTTGVDVHKTLSEIQKTLVEHGARKLMYDYDPDGHIESLTFSITTPLGEKMIRLPANVPAIHEVLKGQKKSGKIRAKTDYAQSERVAWRIIKDWVEAQMAIIESNQVKMDEVFFSYTLNENGKTFFQAYQQNLLPAINSLPRCFVDLGFKNKPNDLKELSDRYRELAKIHHPDVNNGDDKMFKEVGKAYEEALAYFKTNLSKVGKGLR